MLVMHIGPHKTATTYIQHNFHESRTALEARGWVYPKLGTEGLPGHHDLAHDTTRYIAAEGDKTKALARLAQEAQAQSHNLVFSAEGFCRWGRPKYDAFRDLTGAEQIDLVYVVRDPLDIFYSYWAEEVKQGWSTSLPERFSEHFNDPLASRLLNPMVDLNKLKRLDYLRLHVVPFEALRRQGIDIYEHICQRVLGLQDMAAGSSKPKNTSFPIELTEFLRMMTLMDGRGNRRLEAGSAMRLRFTSQVSNKERNELVAMVRKLGVGAKREISFPNESLYKRRIARGLIKGAQGMWTREVGEDELYRFDQEKTYTHYDSYTLMQQPKIFKAGQDILARIAA